MAPNLKGGDIITPIFFLYEFKLKIQTFASKQDPDFFVAYVDHQTMQSKH